MPHFFKYLVLLLTAVSIPSTSAATHNDLHLPKGMDYTVSFWVKTSHNKNNYQALITNKAWDSGKEINLISTSNMGMTRDSGKFKGFTIGIQPSDAYFWNIGNGKSRLDYLPTAKRQPINNNNWHLLVATFSHTQKECRIYYNGKNVAIYTANHVLDHASDQPLQAVPSENTRIEELTVAKRVLRPKDIRAMYKKRFPLATQAIKTHQGDTLKILNWNIWHGGRHNGTVLGVDQVIEVIQNAGPDIITMQETYGSGPKIADKLGFYFYLRSSNISVMSRYPISETYDLYHPFYLGGANIQLDDKRDIDVFSLWISSAPDFSIVAHKKDATLDKIYKAEEKYRLKNITSILELLKPITLRDTPLVVAGDYNSPSAKDWTSKTTQWHNGLVVNWPVVNLVEKNKFIDSFKQIHKDETLYRKHIGWKNEMEVNWMNERIDYIFTKGDQIQTIDSRMIRHHQVKWPSDHPVVFSTFKIKSR